MDGFEGLNLVRLSESLSNPSLVRFFVYSSNLMRFMIPPLNSLIEKTGLPIVPKSWDILR